MSHLPSVDLLVIMIMCVFGRATGQVTIEAEGNVLATSVTEVEPVASERLEPLLLMAGSVGTAIAVDSSVTVAMSVAYNPRGTRFTNSSELLAERDFVAFRATGRYRVQQLFPAVDVGLGLSLGKMVRSVNSFPEVPSLPPEEFDVSEAPLELSAFVEVVAGFSLLPNLELLATLRYDHGVTDIGESEFEKEGAYSRTLALGIGARVGL